MDDTGGRPKKTESDIKRRAFQIRLTEDEKGAFEEAARIAGLSGSSWARERLRACAREELKAAGKSVDKIT